MKKTQFHTNPVVNKWEEDQRRARMDKMINRAKSTLPPEARGLSKPSGPKKPSPYTKEMNAPRRGPKRGSSSGEGGGHEGGHGDGTVAVNVQELDGLIYNRLQEILGMPMMRKAAAARAASGTKGTPPKPPRGRRPAWNEEWNAGAAVSPGNMDETPVGPAGGRAAGGAGGLVRDRGAPVAPGSGGSTTRLRTTSARDNTPTRTASTTHRTASPPPLDVQHGATGSTQRRLSSGIPSYGGGERVVLLPSPSAASPGAAMRPSSRYGAGPEAGGGSHVLDRSTVSAIAALNPTAPAAQEAAARLQHYGGATAAAQQREAAGPRSSTAPASASTAAMGDVDATFASYLGASPSASAAGRQHQAGLRGGLDGSTASGPGSDAAAMRSLVSLSTASPGGSPGLGGMGAVTGSTAAGSRRPPLAPRASGAVASSSAMGAYGSPPHGSGLGAAAHGSLVRAGAAGDEEEDNAYEDEEFEEYEGSDGEGGGKGHGDEDDEDNPAALLRQSVHALHGLVQMKIEQEELARSLADSLGPAGHRQSQASHAGQADHAAEMMASMALAGADEDGDGGLGGSSLMDGLKQSDLEYLARLGGGELGHYDPGHSGDDRAFVIEPGAPAGKTKAWGDRQPWANEPTDATTGIDVLRQRQEKERLRAEQMQQQQMQQQRQQQALGRSRAGPVDGIVQLHSSGASAVGMGPGRGGARRASASHAEDEDSVLLGETLTAGRSGGGMVGVIGAVLTEAGLTGPEPTRSSTDPTSASQMQSVSNALAALASSGKINPAEAKALRSQTDALYGSLLQLHQLMSGPRGNELRSPTPSGGGLSPAGGFTPKAQSPSSSPNASQQAAVAAAAAAVAAEGRSAARHAPPPLPLDRAEQRRASDHDGGSGGGHVGGSGPTASHMQLTPKNRLVAEDVAWMAGLVHSLSESLHNSKGEVELPGL